MKKIALLLIVSLLLLPLNGCYDAKDINDLAYVLAIGIDQGPGDLSQYTFQFINPPVITGKDGGGGEDPSGEEPYQSKNAALENIIIEAPTLYTAMDLVNSTFAKEYDFSLLKLIVFSQERAQRGIQPQIDGFLHSMDFHPNTLTAISSGPAAEYLANINPPLEINPARYYDNIFKESFTSYSPDVHLKDFHLDPSMHNRHLALPLVGTSKAKTPDELSGSYGDGVHPSVQFHAGDNTKLSSIQSDILGMAIYQDDRVIAQASAEEALLYHMLMNKVKDVHYDLQVSANQFVVLKLNQLKNARRQLTFEGRKPVITVTLSLTSEVAWAENGGNNLQRETEFTKLASQTLARELQTFLYRCSREYKADIFQFSDIAKRHYLTLEDWQREDWQSLFEQADFHVQVELKVEREGIMVS